VIWVLGTVFVLGLATHNLILAIPADFLIWVAWVLVNPFTSCGWCKGTGKHRLSGSKYFGSCWNPRCQRGTVQRLGSQTAHRARRALIAYHRNRKDT
jgi:hypothetical protein